MVGRQRVRDLIGWKVLTARKSADWLARIPQTNKKKKSKKIFFSSFLRKTPLVTLSREKAKDFLIVPPHSFFLAPILPF